ncbi:alpha/beta hydrolase [Pseudoxanthomonas winnipegensis]|jgi:pimeloyl-ACP methyl ester carboxylesterase|uniref:Alpha/beta hydrolase n=1 Tax=Pseudoxanthomonas winnipegensis TaxID=2480810 RepID=A0ABY1WJI0_9GAMM|nr:alpha/beta hydrolase [Pseudoxanthomonas winnipegensis]TAA09715.1 alpha/beta hydrolase [Pseudoxanthomonas winnipegensis]TAA22907.1 alpha/beta hydrolase [Pseudoxanthomonas winnipegensis]TAH73318.1 alpha/beta hydrolase [Pseudoxanthomonas winnipegensis]
MKRSWVRVLFCLALPATVGAAEAAGARAHRQLSCGDASIDVVVDGRGPTIVLLPSLGRDSLDYDPIAEGLAAKGYQVLRPQPRGLGDSRGPMEGITLADLADDVACTIDQAGKAPAIVVGHAYGNWVARMLAARHPQSVRGVVVAAAAAKTYPKSLSASIIRIADPKTSREDRLKELQATFFAPGNDASVWLDGWHPEVRTSQRNASDATPKALWWSAGGKVPLLDLQAESDPFMPADRRQELREELGPRVSVVTIPGASHALLPEQPQQVVEAIARWSAGLR